MKINALLLCLILTVSAACAQQAGYYTNPVIRGDMADPTMIRIGEMYYATGTSSEWAPHYPVFCSEDLVNWTQTGHIFDRKPEWTSSSFWAPELFHHNGKVFCYYTARRKSDNVSYIGVASSDTPTGSFTDHGLLVEFGTEAIDAFVFDDDGQLYISWKAYGLDNRPVELMASRLSADGLRLEGEPFSLLVDDGYEGMEGQYHFKHGDYYYIIYSAHSCCGPGSDYDVYVARAKSYAGPYEKFGGNPILHGGEGDFQSCGHGTCITTPDGRMFYMCHAYFNGPGFFMGRQPILQELFVTEDGWVQFTTGSLAVATQPVPFPGTVQKPVADFRDDFRDSHLKVDWTWNYVSSDVDVRTGSSKLTLGGSLLPGNRHGSALCLRPQTPDYQYHTRVANTNASLKGLTFYGDDGNLVSLGVSGERLILKSVRNGEETVIAETAAPMNPYLRITVRDGCNLDFHYSADGADWVPVADGRLDGSANVRWDRIARPGLIHNGGEDSLTEFSYFELNNL